MSKQHKEFSARLQRLENKHASMAHGYSAHVRPDGLIVVAPKKIRSGISRRVIVLFLLCFWMFKILLIALLGLDSYHGRVVNLQNGTSVEQLGAIIMHADPISASLAAELRPFLR